MKKSKIIVYLTLFFAALFSSCEKDENEDQGSDGKDAEGKYSLQFENYDYHGNLLVVFTDGTSKSIKMKDGKLNLPVNAEGSKTIKTIQLDDQQPILIGRKENENIKLKFEEDVLVHRDPVDGFIPIGTYAEFQLINNDPTTTSRNYQLEADIDLMNEEWKPIGSGVFNSEPYYYFTIFEGNNHEIHNLKITNYTGTYIGLFGAAANTAYVSEIRNLTIRSGTISIPSNMVAQIGSIVGSGHKVINCTSYCHITTNSGMVGGIVGQLSSTEGYVSNCHNYGTIEVKGGHYIGGILSYAGNNIKIDNSSNHGDITRLASDEVQGGGYIGGIVGEVNLSSASHHLISNCKNTGKITNKGAWVSYMGGIAGQAANVINCENTGAVETLATYDIAWGQALGGITGRASSVRNCKNTGKVKGGETIGGIVGIILNNLSSPCSNNANLGDIEGGATAGGIAGVLSVGPQSNVIMQCTANYNKGNVTGNEQAGGIVGEGYSLTILNCYNTGNITGERNDRNVATFVGGISSSNVFVQNNYNIGKINNNNPHEDSKSFGIGRAALLMGPPFTNYLGNFWIDHPDDTATTAFTPSTNQHDNSELEKLALQFSATAWPQWDLSANGWKSLGSWNNGNPVYPKLHFEE